MSEQQDQDRTEEPTPFRLSKAREKGQVARGMDLGFVGSLLAIAAVATIGGAGYFARLGEAMRRMLGPGLASAREPGAAIDLIGSTYWIALQPLLVVGAVLVVILVALEIIQLRGFIFSTHPLKPDFQRLNPAKGLKRLFSIRMLKETLKNILKMAVYGATAWFLISQAMTKFMPVMTDAKRVSDSLAASATRLLFVFIAIAFVFMVIDQLLVRREFHKQMRMSRRDVTRESKDREGEPRFKQKRRDLHSQMRAQAEGLGKIAGSDLLVTNPEHFAVALRYDPETMAAPEVRARGRNHFAQLMKRKAALLGIPVLANPRLARALHADCRPGQPIQPQHYHAVAALYHQLARVPRAEAEQTEANA